MNPGKNPDTGEPYLAPEKLKWFQNKQFRQAVAHVIDKETIIADVQHGVGYPQWSSISPAAGDFHNPDVRKYDYDLDKANDILDGLGWVDTDGDGVREDGEGNEIEFTLVTNTGNSVRAKVGTIVHGGMGEIGLEVDYKVIEFGDLVAQFTATYDWEAMIIGFTGGTDRTEASPSGTAARGCTCGTRTSGNPRRSGRPKSTSCTSRAARSWTAPGASSTTTAPRRSPPGTCRSSTRHSRSGWARSETSSAILRPRCTGSGTSATCTGRAAVQGSPATTNDDRRRGT